MYYTQSDFRTPPNKDGFKKPAYGGVVTKGVKRRMSRAVDIFLQTTETRQIFNTVTQRYMDFRLGFVTLTISDTCTWKADKCYTELLKPFLRVVKEKHNVKKYLWKYELQGRGNVHYHVTVDEFIPHDAIRATWNKIQKRNGLTDLYAQTYGHFNPNSTDIHKVWKIKNIGAYLGKYLIKGNKGVVLEHSGFNQMVFERDVKGKVWDCSTDLKRNRFSTEMNYENEDRLNELVRNGKAELINLDKCTVIKLANPERIFTEDQKIDYMVWKYQ